MDLPPAQPVEEREAIARAVAEFENGRDQEAYEAFDLLTRSPNYDTASEAGANLGTVCRLLGDRWAARDGFAISLASGLMFDAAAVGAMNTDELRCIAALVAEGSLELTALSSRMLLPVREATFVINGLWERGVLRETSRSGRRRFFELREAEDQPELHSSRIGRWT